MRWWTAIALAVALSGAPAAQAERVFVSASSEEQGHGWLFGAEWDGKVACWIAVPRHVVRERGGDGLLPFNFVTATGRTGDTGTPFWIGDVEGAVDAASGQQDLAFALVASGGGDCRSRLGLPDYAYAGFIESIDQLTTWSMSPTSYGPFSLRIERATIADGGGLLRLTATTPELARQYLSGGISGAVVEADRNGTLAPVAMILQVDPQSLTALALRFDRVRAAFRLVEAEAKRAYRDDLVASDGLPIAIDEAIGLPLAGSKGPSALTTAEGCFRMAPKGGQRAVDIIVSLTDKQSATRGMALASGDCAAPGASYIVEQRAEAAGSWSVVKTCTVDAALPEEASCRFELRAPRQFRIRVPGTVVELAAIRFY